MKHYSCWYKLGYPTRNPIKRVEVNAPNSKVSIGFAQKIMNEEGWVAEILGADLVGNRPSGICPSYCLERDGVVIGTKPLRPAVLPGGEML